MKLAEFTTKAGLVGFQKWQRSLVAAERAACRLAPVLASCLLALLAACCLLLAACAAVLAAKCAAQLKAAERPVSRLGVSDY